MVQVSSGVLGPIAAGDLDIERPPESITIGDRLGTISTDSFLPLLRITLRSGTFSLIGGALSIIGATHPPARRAPNITLPAVYVRSAWPPFPVIAELTSANSITASWTRMDIGQARLSIHERDPQITADVLRPGNILSIESLDLPIWAGPLRDWPHRLSAGEYELNAVDLTAILDNRDMTQGLKVSEPVGWEQRVTNALIQANLRALTGIFPPPIMEQAPSIDSMQEGGQSLKAYLEQGHNETDYEWWIEIEATRAYLEATLHIGFRQGEELSEQVHLWNGLHYQEVEYKQDFSQVKQSFTMYGDFGASLPSRTTAARVGHAGPHDIAGLVESATPFALDELEALPPGLRNEKTDFDLMAADDSFQLSKSAQRGEERPLRSVEQFAISANRALDWRYYRVGNRLGLHASAGFQNLDRAPRITAVQADFDRGVCLLTMEVG